ncbi:unnamed protein product, partial [Gulo gulo]
AECLHILTLWLGAHAHGRSPHTCVCVCARAERRVSPGHRNTNPGGPKLFSVHVPVGSRCLTPSAPTCTVVQRRKDSHTHGLARPFWSPTQNGTCVIPFMRSFKVGGTPLWEWGYLQEVGGSLPDDGKVSISWLGGCSHRLARLVNLHCVECLHFVSSSVCVICFGKV